MDQAACAAPGVNPEWFFPSSGEFDHPGLTKSQRKERYKRDQTRARTICETCPLQRSCLEQNLDERLGIYGGMIPSQRAAILKTQGRKLKPRSDEDFDWAVVERVRQGSDVPMTPAVRRELVRQLTAEGFTEVGIAAAVPISARQVSYIKKVNPALCA